MKVDCKNFDEYTTENLHNFFIGIHREYDKHNEFIESLPNGEILKLEHYGETIMFEHFGEVLDRILLKHIIENIYNDSAALVDYIDPEHDLEFISNAAHHYGFSDDEIIRAQEMVEDKLRHETCMFTIDMYPAIFLKCLFDIRGLEKWNSVEVRSILDNGILRFVTGMVSPGCSLQRAIVAKDKFTNTNVKRFSCLNNNRRYVQSFLDHMQESEQEQIAWIKDPHYRSERVVLAEMALANPHVCAVEFIY